MLQNHCKGTDFSPNNQKKTQKKNHKLATFLIEPLSASIIWQPHAKHP